MATPSESATYSNENDSNVTSDNDDAIGAIMNSTTSHPVVTTTTNLNHVHQQHKDVPVALEPANIPDKVKIHFVAVGSAPILKRTKFQINSDQRFAAVHVFLRKLLKLSPTEHNTMSTGSSNNNATSNNQNNLFLYCCSAFAPSPDHLIGELRDSFANVHTKELVIHYSIQEAWG